jgi:hypothetical protein
MIRISAKHAGALFGLFLGWLIIQYGLVAAVFVLALAAAGWIVGRVLDGEIDVSRYIRRPGDDEY